MKKFLSKVKSLAKRSKVAVVAAVAAVSSAVVSVCASAATTEASGTDMKSMLAEAGNQLQKSFSDLVMTLIPVVLGGDSVDFRLEADHFNGVLLHHHGQGQQNDFAQQGKQQNRNAIDLYQLIAEPHQPSQGNANASVNQ